MTIGTLTKRLDTLEARQPVKTHHVLLSEKIALYEKYFSGEIPIPEEFKEQFDRFKKQLLQ
ncbi:MAG TPA: hypothetical protein VKL21_07730 [Candidatus Methanoperedens sp.]|nr:hypothetical protein [Candidatus Methanoperedens sp.]